MQFKAEQQKKSTNSQWFLTEISAHHQIDQWLETQKANQNTIVVVLNPSHLQLENAFKLFLIIDSSDFLISEDFLFQNNSLPISAGFLAFLHETKYLTHSFLEKTKDFEFYFNKDLKSLKLQDLKISKDTPFDEVSFFKTIIDSNKKQIVSQKRKNAKDTPSRDLQNWKNIIFTGRAFRQKHFGFRVPSLYELSKEIEASRKDFTTNLFLTSWFDWALNMLSPLFKPVFENPCEEFLDFDRVYIDIEQGFLPFGTLIHLLTRFSRLKIVFFHSSQNHLEKSIYDFLKKIHRTESLRIKYESLWKNRILWLTEAFEINDIIKRYPLIKPYPSGKLTISWKNHHLPLMQIFENASFADLPQVECAHFEEKINKDLARLVGKKILVNPIESTEFCSVDIKRLFFIELLLSCLNFQISCKYILSCLETSGWKMISQIDFWDNFLRFHQIGQSPTSPFMSLFQNFKQPSFGMSLPLEGRLPRYTSWRQFEEWIDDQTHPSTQTKPKHWQVSLHFEFFCAFMYLKISSAYQFPEEKNQQLKSLFESSFNFPKRLGSLDGFISRYGKNRIFYYAKQRLKQWQK